MKFFATIGKREKWRRDKPRELRAVLVILVLIGAPLAALRADNLITNGSFSGFGSTPPTFSGGSATLASGSFLAGQTNNTAITGWSFVAGATVVGGTTVDTINQASSSASTIPDPPSGQNFDVQLAATAGLLTSTSVTATTTAAIQVVAGGSYDLRFFINSQADITSAATGTIAINGAAIAVTSSTISTIGGALRAGASATHAGNTVTMNTGTIGTSSKTQAWDQVDVLFNATASGNIQLVFAGTSAGNGLALSNITLSTTPEAASWKLTFGFAIVCIGYEAVRRRRSRSNGHSTRKNDPLRQIVPKN
jgi:hypothetical protein